jgi:hypothetical protein
MSTPTPNIPNLQSYEQLLSDMISSYNASVGVDDENVGSVNLSFFEVVALTVARATGSVFQSLVSSSVDYASGPFLQLLAQDNNVTPTVAAPTTGLVNIIDTSFTKISTNIYAGTLAPNVGATSINVSNGSAFPATGSIYLGRGTPNIEGPIAYSSVSQVGSYWTFQLSTPTTKYHNLNESIVLSQHGNRSIPANTIIVAPGVGNNPNIQYSLVAAATILDGETEVDNVQVIALLPGSAGNIPASYPSMTFASLPLGLTSATVTNPLPFDNGTDNATNDQIRAAIKLALASIGLGTVTAIQNSLIGAYASDVNDTITSVSYEQNTDGSYTYFVDDGSGYEATWAGVGLEPIVTLALGGEQYFQLQTGGTQAPVTKPFLLSTLGAPFDLQGGDTLAVIVGQIETQHTFATTDFVTAGAATAYEVCASINGDSTLNFEAVTSGGGVYVVIRPIGEPGLDTIQVTVPSRTSGNDAAVQMGFPTNESQTLLLYRDNILLTEDGLTASIFTQSQELWSPTIQSSTITGGETLSIMVDGTGVITYLILDSDFLNTGLYPTIAATNSLASWIEVFNNKFTGITASISGDQIELTSNLGTNNRAALTILNTVQYPSSLVNKAMFSSMEGLSSVGRTSDFTLDRNTAEFSLAVPLVAGDQLSAGSANTEASLASSQIILSTLEIPTDAHMWILLDTPGTMITTGVVADSALTVTKPATNIVRFTSSVVGAFANTLPGDYVITWSPELPVSDQLEGRIYGIDATSYTYIDMLITAAEYAAATPTGSPVTLFENGMSVIRTELAPQKFRVQAGIKTLYQIASELQTQSTNVLFSVVSQQYLTMTTVTLDTSGSLLVAAVDDSASLFNFTVGSSAQSQNPLFAYRNSLEYAGDLPLFINSVFSDAYANPIDTYVQSITSSVNFSTRDPNELIGILNPYRALVLTTTGNTHGTNQLTGLASTAGIEYGDYIIGNGIPINTTVVSLAGSTVTMSDPATATATGITVKFTTADSDAQPHGEYVQEDYITGTTIGIADDVYIRRVRSVDRFFLANPLDFGHNDSIVTILNNDPTNETFTVPLYRPALTNNTYAVNPTNFNAYDVNSGPSAQFATTFGSTFDFSNFKVLMQAKNVLKPTPTQTAILYRATPWGRSGQYITVSYQYPSSANQPINSSVTVTTLVNINIYLASGIPDVTSIDSSTQWNVTITANTPSAGIDQVTYTWNGTGTNPNLSLSGGEYVNISSQSGFNAANVGIFRVSTQSGYTPTSTSFSVQRPNDVAIVQSNIPTMVNGAITFYESAPTTAAEIAAYVDSNLSSYISATLVSDGGTSGAGIIAYSTYEDSGFTTQSAQLVDGINWIASSNLAANTITATGNLTVSEYVISGVFPTTGIKLGASVSGDNIQGGSTVTAIDGSEITISLQALANDTGVSLTFINTGSPQFIFKKPLTLDEDGPSGAWYMFNNGETLMLVPTTMDQVERLISVFAVSGFISDGNINLADRNSILELSTNTIGSAGALQITGGIGNQYSVPVLNNAVVVNGNYIQVSVNNIASQGVHSDQWFRLQAEIAQKKTTGIYSNTNVTITPNDPIVGSSEVQLYNRLLTQRYLGKARSINLNGLTFRVEKQGKLVCITWTGSDPAGLTTSYLQQSVNFNASGGGTLNVTLVPNTNDSQYFIVSGAATFSGLSIGDSITISGLAQSGNNGTFLLTGVSNDGLTIEVTNPTAVVASGDSYTGSTFSATTGVSEGDSVIIGAPFAYSNQGTYRVIRTFTDSFWIENPDVVEEEQVLTSSSLTFYEYEATIPGDLLVITGSILGAVNAGTYTVAAVLNNGGGHYNDTVVIAQILTSQSSVNLTGNESAIYILEGVPYTGYKHVYLVSTEPDNSTRNLVVLDTTAQYEKINPIGGVDMVSLSKLDFATPIEVGLDAYSYNTGLIREANRIIYGDPRDPITYPGVGASGADNYTREPLVLRVTMTIEVRLQTGAPFTSISQQIQSSVASLINSNPVGVSIDFSSIVSAARAIPGITSVVISSPLYSPTDDLIVVQPSEKTRVIDQSTDIAVSLLT